MPTVTRSLATNPQSRRPITGIRGRGWRQIGEVADEIVASVEVIGPLPPDKQAAAHPDAALPHQHRLANDDPEAS